MPSSTPGGGWQLQLLWKGRRRPAKASEANANWNLNDALQISSLLQQQQQQQPATSHQGHGNTAFIACCLHHAYRILASPQTARRPIRILMGGATGGCGGGDNVPPLLGPAGFRGYRGGPMKMIFASSADSLYSVLYKWLNFNSPDSSRHLPS